MATTAQEIKAILAAAGGSYVTVSFTKRDGSIRELTFDPQETLPTKGAPRNRPEGLFTVVEAGKRQWRSFRADSVLAIGIGGH